MTETKSRARSENSKLKSDLGVTTIGGAVVASIAGAVAQEISGAETTVEGTRIPGDNSPTVGELFGNLTGSARGTRGVTVEVGETQAVVDLTITVPYGIPIPDIAKSLRERVIQSVESMTGLEVTEVNITIKDVSFPEQ